MGIKDVLSLICGIAMFLFGMEVMGDALKKSAGKSLKTTLGKMTSKPVMGFMLGLMVTGIIQSSSATTVMVVGFVNSATMTLTQAVGVIMGANVGTAVTSWITGLSGLGERGATVSGAMAVLKPSSWVPIIAIVGICLIMFSKRGKKRDIGTILLGFSVLMVGMEMMSDAVSVLQTNAEFKRVLLMFKNPILGVLAGLILTAIIQSSSASIGILQSLTATGAITYGTAIPIIMGQNIGTCVTALLSSVGANKNGKRAALIHLYFNVIGMVVWLSLFYLFDWIFKFAFVDSMIDMWGIALVHTLFKLLSVLLLAPFSRLLEKLAVMTVHDRNEAEAVNILDDRLFATPAVAVESAANAAYDMARLSCEGLKQSIKTLSEYDPKTADAVRSSEEKVDIYEDTLGSYLVKLSGENISDGDRHEITMLLHIIGDLERISDHSVNVLDSAEEMQDKKLTFSDQAKMELSVLSHAITEILDLTCRAFAERDMVCASRVEPLEQTVDYLKDQIKLHHVLRLQKSECSIEHGFVLNDLLTNFERVADHCSNIAGCMLEMLQHDSMEMHKYLGTVKAGGEEFDRMYKEFRAKYSL